MLRDRETLLYINPNSARSGAAEQKLHYLLDDIPTRRVESRTPNLRQNAEDLAGELADDSLLIVVGGDGQVRTAAEAIKLSKKHDTVLIAVEAGNSCDTKRSLHDEDLLSRGRLPKLLDTGVLAPVNTLDININGQPYGTAVGYAGFGLTGLSAATVNRQSIRDLRAKLPTNKLTHNAMRFVEGAAIGKTVFAHLDQPLHYVRDGQEHTSMELLYAGMGSLAGMFKLGGEALVQDNPQIARYEIDAEAFLRKSLIMFVRLRFGRQDFVRTPEDTVTFSADHGLIPMQLDGENDLLEPGSTVNARVHHKTFMTYLPAA